MFIAVMMAATLMGTEEASASPPAEIPVGATVCTRADAQNFVMDAGYYPPKAKRLEINGSATVDCQVDANGELSRCVVIKETPPDMGFGEATALAFLKYARVKPEEVEQIGAGGWKKFTFRWKYAD
ncbi:TonB family protein [Asticcacaulis sp.]|uniref:TonB family protein n=1 Tax=Asticcacaulis sp. TaxID=1872648 RepID=UPI002C025BB9|nr:TonB family protein [Asticcacaulis sp.]HTM80982.1 TonB family protein [Asticcacaulis sp.]